MPLPAVPVPGEGVGAGLVFFSSVAVGVEGEVLVLSELDFSFRLELAVSLRLLSVDFFLLLLLSAEEGRRPREVSLEGIGVAFAGMELSYSWFARSIADRILAFMVMPRVSARVARSLDTSGIQ